LAIPLQSTGGGPDSFTERSLGEALAHLFGYVFVDLDTAQSFKNGVAAARAVKRLGEVVEKAVNGINRRGIIHRLGQWWSERNSEYPSLDSYGPRLVARFLDKSRSVDETVWTIIPTAAATYAPIAQGVRSPTPPAPLVWIKICLTTHRSCL
jgi:hypothetical protein